MPWRIEERRCILERGVEWTRVVDCGVKSMARVLHGCAAKKYVFWPCEGSFSKVEWGLQTVCGVNIGYAYDDRHRETRAIPVLFQRERY